MGRRRIKQTKSFWFEGSKVYPSEMDKEVNLFLQDTPGILCTAEFVPEVSWGEVGGFVICSVSYYTLTTSNVIRNNNKSKDND
jgi:hypothetical protein